MLFDLRPKEDIKDFFNRRRELNKFLRSIDYSQLTLVLGPCRCGKTSLILTGLNHFNKRYIYIDCKKLPPGMIGLREFINLLIDSINIFIKKNPIFEEELYLSLSKVDSIDYKNNKLIFNSYKFKNKDIIKILSKLNELEENIILVLDEAHELRRLAKYRFDKLLSYVHENFRNIRIVLVSSQVGLIYRFLRIGDPASPLYKKDYRDIRLGRLNREESYKFLINGYQEYDLEPSWNILEYIVENLDGVIGWLTYIGYKTAIYEALDIESVDSFMIEASKIIYDELNEFLMYRGFARNRYIELLRAVATLKIATWSEIYKYLNSRMVVPKKTYNQLLRNLIDSGFIEKTDDTYRIVDPLLEKCFLETLIKCY